MSKRNRYLLTGIAAFAILILLVALVLPVVVRNKTVAALEDVTGRHVKLSSLSINPFTLSVTVEGFAIEESGSAPLAAFKQLRASLAPASIYKRALILSSVSLDTPSLSFVRTAPNRFSFSDILDRLNARPKQKESRGEFHFSINNITVQNGSLDFEDRMVGGRKHTVRALDIAVPFVSNIPYLADRYIDPRISATVNDAPFSFSGKLKPLSKSLETSVHVGLKELDLPRYLAYAPTRPKADLTSGKLTLDLDVAYRISNDKKPELTLKGLLQLDDLALDLPDRSPLARLSSLQAKAARVEVLARRFEFESIKLRAPELFVSRDGKGAWIHSRLLAPDKPPAQTEGAAPPKPATAKEDNQPPLFTVSSLSCDDGTVHLNDLLPKGGFKTTVSDIDLAIKDFSTEREKSATYQLSLVADKDTVLKSGGAIGITPLALTSSLQLSGFPLQRVWPYLTPYLTAPVKGKLDLAAKLAFSESRGLDITDGGLSVSDLSARYGVKEGIDLAKLEVKEAAYRQKENRLEMGELRLTRGEVSLSLDPRGKLSLLSLFAGDRSGAGASAKTASAAAPAKGKAAAGKPSPFAYLLKRFQADRLNLAFTDKSRRQEARFTLRNTNLTLANLQGPKFTPAALRFSSTFGKECLLKASGAVTPLPFRYQGTVHVKRLPIRDFEAYFPETLNFRIVGGTIDTDVKLDLAIRDGKPAGTFQGSAGVRSFHSIDGIAEEDLLKWESLQFDDIRGGIDPFTLSMRQVALNGVYSRIIIRKDGTLNLQNLVGTKEAPAQGVAATAAPATPVAVEPAPSVVSGPVPAAAASRRRISVANVTIQDGTLAFTDNHLPQTFSSTFYNLGGRISGLTSEESKFADLDLRGNLESHSPMQITGRLNPLREDLFVDLKISFRDIDLAPVTPYSGTYLGYTVDKGKLFLDLKYLIDKKALNSENRIFIDQFSFGSKVESEKATTLPVRLAVALLKDRKGEIHLDLPVTGRTDDPQFSIWALVKQVLSNLLAKAATSPFALLSSLAGSGEDFSVVRFPVGSSRIPDDEEKKLGQMARALADRPGLKIEIKGFVDKAKDPEGYSQEMLERKLRNEKFLKLAKEKQNREGESADTVQILSDEYPKLLKAVYLKEKFPKPRNALGLVKDLPDHEMKKLIIANTVVGENELQALARERAATVMNHLVAKGGLAPERLFQKNEDIYKAPQQENVGRSRVEFNVIAQ